MRFQGYDRSFFSSYKSLGSIGSLLLIVAMATMGSAQAQTKAAKGSGTQPAPATDGKTKEAAKEKVTRPGANSDAVDISDLETKYWAPKDTDFSVVQNRTYTKERRFSLGVGGGSIVNDGYSEGLVYSAAANYYFSERYGIEAHYIKANLKNNDPTNQLKSFGGGVQPDFGRMDSFYGVGFNWVPFYAKMSVMAKKIIYFDMAFTPAVGMMNYEQIIQNGNKEKSALAYGLDVTQYFFFTNHFSLRMDLRNRWFKEDVAKYYTSGGIPGGTTFRSKTTHTMLFLLGINVFF